MSNISLHVADGTSDIGIANAAAEISETRSSGWPLTLLDNGLIQMQHICGFDVFLSISLEGREAVADASGGDS